MRRGDALARVGGGEFVVVIEDVGDTDLMVAEVSRRMLTAVEGEAVEVADEAGPAIRVGVGCSIGGTLWPADGDTLPQVIRCADCVRYAAKRAGKHRLVMAEGLTADLVLAGRKAQDGAVLIAGNPVLCPKVDVGLRNAVRVAAAYALSPFAKGGTV